MNTLCYEAYRTAGIRVGSRVTAETEYCTYVNGEAATLMRQVGLKPEYLEYEYERHPYHGFIRLQESGPYLVDLQFKQFVPKEMRRQLPDYLVVQYQTQDDVIEGLTRYSVPRDFHHAWVTELFWDKR